jgi:5'-methylthioadenosine phosphorylase
VVANLLKNVATAKEVLRRLVPSVGPTRTCPCPALLRNAIITAPGAFPPAARRRLELLIGKYFPRPPRGRAGSRPTAKGVRRRG